MSSREIIKMLKKDGWTIVRTKGSHHKFAHPTKPGLVTVPNPEHDLPKGTANAILKAAGLK